MCLGWKSWILSKSCSSPTHEYGSTFRKDAKSTTGLEGRCTAPRVLYGSDTIGLDGQPLST